MEPPLDQHSMVHESSPWQYGTALQSACSIGCACKQSRMQISSELRCAGRPGTCLPPCHGPA
eukprot:365831-Chlamydomonas_euryale.AAC.3